MSNKISQRLRRHATTTSSPSPSARERHNNVAEDWRADRWSKSDSCMHVTSYYLRDLRSLARSARSAPKCNIDDDGGVAVGVIAPDLSAFRRDLDARGKVPEWMITGWEGGGCGVLSGDRRDCAAPKSLRRDGGGLRRKTSFPFMSLSVFRGVEERSSFRRFLNSCADAPFFDESAALGSVRLPLSSTAFCRERLAARFRRGGGLGNSESGPWPRDAVRPPARPRLSLRFSSPLAAMAGCGSLLEKLNSVGLGDADAGLERLLKLGVWTMKVGASRSPSVSRQLRRRSSALWRRVDALRVPERDMSSSSTSEEDGPPKNWSWCCGWGVLGALLATVKTLTSWPSGLLFRVWITTVPPSVASRDVCNSLPLLWGVRGLLNALDWRLPDEDLHANGLQSWRTVGDARSPTKCKLHPEAAGGYHKTVSYFEQREPESRTTEKCMEWQRQSCSKTELVLAGCKQPGKSGIDETS